MWEEKGETTVLDNTKPRYGFALCVSSRFHWRSSLPLSLPAVCFSVIVRHCGPTWKRITGAWFHHHWMKNMSVILVEWGIMLAPAYQDFNDIFPHQRKFCITLIYLYLYNININNNQISNNPWLLMHDWNIKMYDNRVIFSFFNYFLINHYWSLKWNLAKF